jgi:hypothetical protein
MKHFRTLGWVACVFISAAAHAADTLPANSSLVANQALTSSDGRFTFNMQGDGNLVLRNASGSALWTSGTAGSSGQRLSMQSDGNLVLYTKSGSTVWKTNTSGSKAVKVIMQSDGNLVMRTSAGSAVWATGTNGGTAPDTVKPVITLSGSAAVSIVQGGSYADAGATASDDRDGNITSKIVVSGSVNTATVGTYTLSYNVKDAAGNAATALTRTVTVTPKVIADTVKPVITLNGSATVSVVQGSGYADAGATASDDRDGNVTSRIVVSGSVNTATVGTYTLSYNVKDAAGNAANTLTRAVTVTAKVIADTVKPVITLNGSATVSVVQGGTYADAGATATDDRDGNVTSKIVITGSVIANTPGTYALFYNVKDAAGNAASTLTRTVTVTSSGGNGTVTLPIEVLGTAGLKKSVSFNLASTSGITDLYLRCNACGYDDITQNKNTSMVKATVRVNGGNAIALKRFTEGSTVYGNSQIKVIGGEADYGGIGGTFRTVRFMVPVSGLKVGLNTLTFEHVSPAAPSIGFRIIDLNLLQNGDINRKVLPASAFVQDDPSKWIAPRNNPTDIAAGGRLWTQRDKLYDVSFDLTDGQANGQGVINGRMHASCSNCHAADGRDLKYFNFSNTSIIERSKFHGLSQAEGEQLASYIRSVNIPLVKQARPWNPTYQPGVGMDSKPVYEWAAGAGVDAILDKASDMAPYLFPRGTAIAEVRAVVDRYKTLNFRELPVNIPMPEWNQWLPLIHPDDAFNTSAAAINADNQGRSVGMPFYLKMYNDAKANPTPDNLAGLSRDLKAWLQRDLTCVSNGPGNTDPYRAINGAVMTSLRIPFPKVTTSNCTSIPRSQLANIELAKRGLTAWATVKLWEINHSQNLEERSKNVGKSITSSGRTINASEARGWQADGRNVFDRPPHFTGVDPQRKYLNQSAMQGIFESNAWYHLNMVLNPGYRVTMPSHFAYTYSHVELLQEYSKVNQGYLFWATMIKQRQLQTNGQYGVEAGLDLRTAQPHIYYGTARGKTMTDAQGGVGQPLWGRLVTAMVDDLVADANNASAQDWANASGNSVVQDRNSTAFSPCSGVCTFDIGAFQGQNTYRVIPEFRKMGVEENSIQKLIDWGQKTWPRGPWNNVR